MGEISLSDALSVQGGPAQNNTISIAQSQNLGQSNLIRYTPPAEEPLPIQDRLARGFMRSVSETPQMIGQGLYYLGSNMHPSATKEEQMNGDSFGDRVAKLGIAMSERNKAFIAEKYPETPDIWERVGAGAGMVAPIALGSLLGFPEAAAAATIGAGAVGTGLAAFDALKAQGKSTLASDAASAVVAAGAGTAMAFGIGNFLKATGPLLTQAIKGVVNGFTGGVAISTITGSLQLATGVKKFEGSDSLKDLISEAATTGVTFGILGGPLGVHMALQQHRAIQDGYEQLGLSKKEARDAAKATMSAGMHEGIKEVEKTVSLNKNELSRMEVQPMLKPKLRDNTGSPRADILDEPFTPTEPSRTETLTADLEKQKDNLKLLERDISDLKNVLSDNSNAQIMPKEVIAQQKEVQTKFEGEYQQKISAIDVGKTTQQNQIEKEYQNKFKTLEKKSADLESKLADIQKDHAKLDKYFEQRTAELKQEGISQHSDLDRLGKLSLELGQKEDILHEQIDNLDQKNTELIQATERKHADLERRIDAQKKAAKIELDRQLKENLRSVPALLKMHNLLENLQNEASGLKNQIESLRGKLAPKTTPLQDIQKQIASLKLGFRTGAKMTEDEVKFVQKEFNNLIDQSDLDLNDKAKFRNVLPRVLSVEDFQKVLPAVLNKMTFLENRAEQKEWRDDVSKLKLTELGPDAKDLFKEVIHEKNFKFDSTEPILKTDKQHEFFSNELGRQEPGLISADNKTILTPGEKEALSDMKNIPWGKMNHEQKWNTYEIIKTIHTNLVNENRLLSAFKEKKFSDFRQEYLDKIYGGTAPVPSDPIFLRNKERNMDIWKKAAAVSKAWEDAQTIPWYKFDLVGLDNVHQILHEALSRRTDMQLEGKKLVSKTFDKISQKEMARLFSDKVDFGKSKDPELAKYTGEAAFNGDQLLDIYAHSFNEKGMKHLMSNYSKEAIEEINRYVVEKYPEAAKAVMERFKYHDGPGYEELNTIHRELTGANMPKESFYNPIQYLAHGSGKQLEMDEAQSSKGMLGRAMPNSGMTRGRVASSLAFSRFDYFGNQIRNVMDRANYIAMGKAIRDANKILYDQGIADAIVNTAGEPALKELRQIVRSLAFDGHQMDHTYDNMFRSLRFAFTVGKIGFNPWSAGKVFSQLSPASNYVGGKWVPSAIKDYMTEKPKWDSFIDEKSPFMKNRPMMQEREYIERFLRNGGNAMLTKEEDFLKFSMGMHQVADRIVTRATWLGEYNKTMAQNKAAGINDERGAIYKADLATALTHPTGSDLYLPPLFRGSEAMKWLTVFRKAINTNHNLLMKANQDFGLGKENIFGLAGRYVGVGLIPSVFLAALTMHRRPSGKEVALETLNNTVGTDMAFGYLTDALLRGHKDIEVSTAPVAAFEDAFHVFTEHKDFVSLEHHDKLQDVLATVDDLRGLGLANMYRMGTGKMFKPVGDKEEKTQADQIDAFRGGF